MLYEEFLLGTQAKATKSNYEVYKAIEGVYNLHPTMTKEEAYELAQPMIDNELTPEEEALLEYIDGELLAVESILDDVRENRHTHEDEVTAATDEDARRRALARCQEDDVSIARLRGKRRAFKAIAAHIRTGR